MTLPNRFAGSALVGSPHKDPVEEANTNNYTIQLVSGGKVMITNGAIATITLAAPDLDADGATLTIISTTAFAHTVESTYYGSNTVATFGGAIGDSIVLNAYNGVWYVAGSPQNVVVS